MPIRFRCAYCNQLMGIARRKAGTIVTCPTCSGKVVVPQPSTSDELRSEQQAAPPIFERSDFDDVLQPASSDSHDETEARAGLVPVPVQKQAATPPPPSGAWGTNADQVMFDVEPVDPMQAAPAPATAEPEGIVVSPMTATILTVVIIVLLAVAFGAGVLVGKYVLS